MTDSISNDDLLLIGTIVAPFGVKGQMKLKSISDRPDHISRHVRDLFIGKDRAPFILARLHEHKPGLLIMSLRGVDTREAAEDLRGAEVYIREREAAPLAAGEYFLHQLPGIQVLTEDGTVIGTVKEVLETGANEVLLVSRPGQSEVLIPLVSAIVTTLDIPGGKAIIRPIEGLL